MATITSNPFNDPETVLREAQEFFLRAARDMRAYTSYEVQAAIIKIAEYLMALADALIKLVAEGHHTYIQKHAEIEAQELSPALLRIDDE